MREFEVIPYRLWVRDDGAKASVYGSVPWTSDAERERWAMETRGWTIRDNLSNTIGLGRPPFDSQTEAESFAEKLNAKRDAERAYLARERASVSETLAAKNLPKSARDFALKHRLNLGRDEHGYFVRDGAEIVERTRSAKPTAKNAIAMMRRVLAWKNRKSNPKEKAKPWAAHDCPACGSHFSRCQIDDPRRGTVCETTGKVVKAKSKRKRNPSKMTGVETVTTHELRNGDVIASHGSLFKLKDRKVSQSHDVTDYGGEVIWFRTAYLGPLLKGGQESIPSALRKDWVIQGNKLATWARITAAKGRKRNPVANRKRNPNQRGPYVVIGTKFLPATNTKGSRVKAQDNAGKSVTVGWDHALDSEKNHEAAAYALLEKTKQSGTKLDGYPIPGGRGWSFVGHYSHGERLKNPAPKLGFAIYAQKGSGPRMHYDGEKFSNNGAPKLYQTQQGAAIVARNALARYPILKPYRVTVEPSRGK